MTEQATRKIVTDAEKRIEMAMIPIDSIIPNEWNPNEMDDALFNELTRDLGEDGFLQTITVVPVRVDGKIRYRIVDGEHRFNAMKLADYPEIPCLISKGDLARDEDKQRFKTVRMNKIRGKLNQKKLKTLVEDLAGRHPLARIAEEFIVDDPAELEALIGKVRKDLPTEEMRKELDKAKSEIKTIEDLSTILNKLFATYGDTLSHNYMIVEYGGKNHLWVRLKDAAQFSRLKKIAEVCRKEGVSFDRALMHVVEKYLVTSYIKGHREEFEGKSNGS